MKLNRSQILLPILILVIIFTFLTLTTPIFTIKAIDVQLEKVGCASGSDIKNSSNILGQNFFLVNKDSAQQELKGKFICIRTVDLSKFFPSRVRLEVLGRQPSALLFDLETAESSVSATLENIATPSADISREAYLIDNEGVVFTKELSDLNIPKIFLKDVDLSVGKKLNDHILDSLKILDKIEEFGIDVKLATVWNNFFVIYSFPKIIFRLDNIDTQIASLQLILKKAKIDASQLEFIDLRFDKPIVRIAPKKS